MRSRKITNHLARITVIAILITAIILYKRLWATEEAPVELEWKPKLVDRQTQPPLSGGMTAISIPGDKESCWSGRTYSWLTAITQVDRIGDNSGTTTSNSNASKSFVLIFCGNSTLCSDLPTSSRAFAKNSKRQLILSAAAIFLLACSPKKLKCSHLYRPSAYSRGEKLDHPLNLHRSVLIHFDK